MSFVASPHSSRPYFPMLLANGKDAVLVGYTGSMMIGDTEPGHNERNQGVVCGWYKTAHRTTRIQNILPVLQAGYRLYCQGEFYDVSDFTQSFDAKQAVLTTRIRASGFELSVQSDLSRDSVLQEYYRVERVPTGVCDLHLYVNEPTSGLYPCVLPHVIQYEFNDSQGEGAAEEAVEFRYEVGAYRGLGYHRCDSVPDQSSRRRFVFTGIKAGFEVTRSIGLRDDAEARGAQEGERASAWLSIRNSEKHAREWSAYTDQSSIALPDSELQSLYDLSIYTLRAHQQPEVGSVTTGMFPPLWGGGGIFGYDSYYIQQAMLRSNHVKQSSKLVSFWNHCKPAAAQFAKELGVSGLFFPWWSLTPLGQSNGIPKDLQIACKRFDTCAVALQVLRHYEGTGDTQFLQDHWDLATGCVDFLLCETILEGTEDAVIKDAEGATESVAVQNDTLTAVVTIKVLEMLVAYAPRIEAQVPDAYGRILQKLRVGLKRNTVDGVLMPFRGALAPMTLPLMLSVWNLPEGIGARSIEASLQHVETKWGLSSGVCNQQYRDWPWFHFRVAIARVFEGVGDPLQYIQKGTKRCSSLGAFPEKVRLDGQVIGYWYSTVHALFVFAIDCLLVNEANGDINVLSHVPDAWRDVSFQRLRVPPGYLVSATVRDGLCQHLVVKNDTAEKRRMVVTLPSRFVVPAKLADGSCQARVIRYDTELEPGEDAALIAP